MKTIWALVLSVMAAVLLVNLGLVPVGSARSEKWAAARASHLQAEGWCALCGTQKDLEVHHLTPFHVAPVLELDPANLITLCRHCHLEAGHLGNWTNDVPGLRVVIGEVGANLHRMRPIKDTAQPVR